MRQHFYSAVVGAILFLSLSDSTCKKKAGNDCIDKTKISGGPCTMEYDPVCGCDGKTYSNPCIAGRAGLKEWKKGECK